MPKSKKRVKQSQKTTLDSKVRSIRQENAKLKKELENKEWASKKTNEAIKLLYKELEKKKEKLEVQTTGLRKTNKEIKILYKQLEQKNKELQKIDELKSEFVSTVSHELRTPLTTMKEFAAIISDEIPGKLNNDQKEYIDIIKNNIDRLALLINNLLDISKIEAGKIELRRTFIDITGLVKSVVSTLRPQVDKKHIELKTMLPAIKVDVYADPDLIIQIFTNLIGNAIKFTPENGRITVEIKDMDKEIECSVADTGLGITSENLTKLFGKFQQFGREAGAGAKGTGLGLAITKELVQLHNGRIWAESKVNEGSRFIFTLPKRDAELVFNGDVDNGIKQAMKKNSKMSLIVVSLANLNELRNKFTNEAIESFLKDIEDVLKESLRRREGDFAIKGTGAIAVILSDCNKENVLSVQDRIKQMLENYLAEKKMAGEIKFRFGRATYPDEAQNDEELIKKAEEAEDE